MPLSIKNLLAQLNRRRVGWAVEIKNDPNAAYEFLLASLGVPELSLNQTLNGLHMLFKLQFLKDRTDVLRKFLELSLHSDRRVRSEAVQLAVGMVRLSVAHDAVPLVFSDSEERSILRVVEKGLTPKVVDLVRSYFGGRGAR